MDYKSRKELFVSNLQGTSVLEICALTSVAPVRFFSCSSLTLEKFTTISSGGNYDVRNLAISIEVAVLECVGVLMRCITDDTCMYALLFVTYDTVRGHDRYVDMFYFPQEDPKRNEK